MTKMNRNLKNTNKGRRDFIKKSILASSFLILPRHVIGGSGYIPPSDQLALAGIGVGGKGRSDILNASVNGRERVVALCDVHPNGLHGVVESREKFPKAKFYEDFREMLDKHPEIDAVTISGPDHSHAPAAVYSMERLSLIHI